MSIIYILIPIAAILTALGLYLFFWAVKSEQFDDLEKQGLSILFDDEEKKLKANSSSKTGLTQNSQQDKPNNKEQSTQSGITPPIKDNK